MNIIIVGCGKIGTALAEQLSREEHNITVIDTNGERLRNVVDSLDIMGVHGNAATFPVLEEAGAREADLLIAVTASDELNILACLIAKKAGVGSTVARARNPQYIDVLPFIKGDIGLSMSINPEKACAMEILRVLRFPSVISVDTFVGGRVEILEFQVPEGCPIDGVMLKDLFSFSQQILVCAVRKKDTDADVIIPGGLYTIKAGDRLSVAGDNVSVSRFFKSIDIKTDKIKSVFIVGGGLIAFYLAQELLKLGISVKIIERDRKRCELLTDELPKAEIICGDANDQRLLQDEGITKYGAFVSLTNVDEENAMLSLYAGSISSCKVVTKLSGNHFNSVMNKLELGSVFSPSNVASEEIVRFVRAMHNSYGSNVETLYRIVDEKAEALEFFVKDDCSIANIPLMEMELIDNLLIAVINRKGKIIIPHGNDVIKPRDTVIIITTVQGLTELEDIVK